MFNKKKFLRSFLGLVAGVLLFLPAYSSGYSVYEVHADATNSSTSDDQNRKKPGGDGIGIPGLGGSIGSGSNNTGITGTTLGAGTTAGVIPATLSTVQSSNLTLSPTTSAEKSLKIAQVEQKLQKKVQYSRDADGNLIGKFKNKDFMQASGEIAMIQDPSKSFSIKQFLVKEIKKKLGNGVNSFKWNGPKHKGNFTVKLSSGLVNFIRKRAVSLGVGLVLTVLVSIVGGPEIGIMGGLLSWALHALVKAVINDQFNGKIGRTFVFRGWKIKSAKPQ